MSTAIISLKAITKSYGAGEAQVKALKGVSLEISRGDFIIVKGRNGSGKSTLLRQLGLLDQPDSGELYLLGQEVAQLKEKKRTQMRLRNIGYIFQEYALLAELTALENVMLPAMMINRTKDSQKLAQEMLLRVEMNHRLDSLPSQLSGGEKQRVAIARALINNPAVIFADEPTANLDSVAAKEVMEIFQQLNQREKHTIVMVTHESEEETYANRIITLADGEITDIYEK